MARKNLTSGNSTTNATTYPTAIVSPGANRLVLAFVMNARATNQVAATPTLSGNGLTWEPVETVTISTTGTTGDRRLTCFRAMGPAPAAGAISIGFGGETQDFCAWSVFEYDEVETSGTNGSGAVAQSRAQTGAGTSLTVGLNPFADPLNNLTAGAIILVDQLLSPGQVTPAAGFQQIHMESPNQLTGKSGTLQTQDRTGAATTVGWNWNTPKTAGAIALEIKAAVTSGGGSTVEALVRRFEPGLFFHPQESFFPSDAKRYLEHAALWNAEIPFDSKNSWGDAAAPFPKEPMIPSGQIAALPGEPGAYLGHPQFLVAGQGEERFLQLGAWKDKSETPQPEVTATSSNIYADRGSIVNRYASELALTGSRFWYHAEVFDSDRLARLAATVRAPNLSFVHGSLRNPTLICYYLFFPAHEQGVDSGCTNIEAKEVGSFAGEWGCVAVLLEDAPAGPQRPTFIGFTGSQTEKFEQSPGVMIRRPQAFDDERRIVLKVEQWRPGTGPGAVLPEVIDDHPRLYVSLGSHSLYLQPSAHKVEPFPDDAWPSLCGRSDSETIVPGQPAEMTPTWVIFVKFGIPLVGIIPGLIEISDDRFGTPDSINRDAIPDDQAQAAGSGTTVRPAGLNVPDAGSGVEDWRSAQGVMLNGRRYDYLVDRERQVWWPTDDGRGGYQGRWGQRVEADSLPRRAGMRFPQFWKMFLMAIADGKATGLLP
jgi:hypothetical protein